MNPWVIYFYERFYPLLSLTVIIGMALTGVVIDRNLFQPISFVVACVTIFYVAFVFRLRNDIKDYDRDRIAFPNRALPRGLISKKDAVNALKFLEYGLLIYAVLLFIFYRGDTRLALLVTSAYYWMLSNEFYAEKWLERHPLVNGFVQQGFIFFLTLFVISIGRPGIAFASHGISYALLTFAAFFIFDICRKLNPYSHPISMAYVHYYGFKITFWIVCTLLLLSAIGAYGLGVQLWLWPAELAVLLALCILHKDPKKYRIAEYAAALSLLLHTWAGPIQNI